MVRVMPPHRRLPTGAIRFRKGRFGKLVVQVELKVCRARLAPPSGTKPPEEDAICYEWRDITKDEADKLLRYQYTPEPFNV